MTSPSEPCVYCDEPHAEHRVAIHIDEWENTEYRPIETVNVKGGIL